ncbi:helix-turn-helix transcriptional regulator [Bacillus sp. ISL-35]|uniref:helix-turn-helix domain-containing protein n=1 Tax=Bacillus sp. ISL-35 TaxID=2819122 RepID=UPI001BE8EE78|nr:helix-turn-helix transcriptional regulator [Bacillus sp. ISL-35]MBT2680017.1 helix-turn-helix transcriptional regulator [Bacillus sp. ISL-35]MBT2703007.1 helix-turn-helix transcriptional regulator [Chryseobacterium sp. ISL-80]
MSTLGTRIKGLRERRDLPQKELAKKIGVSNVQLSRYESDERRPDYETLKKISAYFEVSIDYLLTGEDQQGSSDEMWKEMLDPKTQIFFKDLMDAPEEKIAELIRFWEFIKERDKE